MNPLASAAINSGLIDQTMLDEFRRWKPPIDLPETVPEPPATLEEAGQLLEEALQSEGFVLTRETDLEILRQYLSTQTAGVLHMEIPPTEPADAAALVLDFVTTKAEIDIMFGRTVLGQYIIGWKSESIASEMTNGLTYLLVGGKKVYFQDVREVFFGGTKAFMVCTHSTVEDANG